MYFLKNNEQGLIDLRDCQKTFDFRSRVYKDHILAVKELLVEKPIVVFDLAAALVSTLYMEAYVHKKAFERALECCRKLLEDLGFQWIDIDTLTNKLRQREVNPRNIVLVAGCQDEQMIRRRAESAAGFCAKWNVNLEVVFSGRNPGAGKNVIDDESQIMLNYFIQYMNRRRQIAPDLGLPKLNTTYFEDASNNTKKNVENFWEKFMLPFRAMPTNVIVVSSTFHLIRLAESLLERLNEAACDVKNLVLVGAEEQEDEVVHEESSARYMKLMMFDVFRCLLRDATATDAQQPVIGLQESTKVKTTEAS